MKICKQCGQANDDDNMFCINCGNNISNDENQNEESEMIVEGVSDNGDNSVNNFFKCKRNIVITAIIAIVIVLCFIAATIFNSPEKKVILGTYSLFTNNKQKSTVEISVNGKTGIEEADKLIKKSKVEFKLNSDSKKREFMMEGSFLLDNKSLLDLNLASMDEVVYFEFPELYDDYFYAEFEKEQMEIIQEYLQLLQYLNGIDISRISSKEYRKVLTEMLAENIEKEDGKVVVSLSAYKVCDFLYDICSIAKDDEELALQIYKSIEKVVEKMDEDNFEPEIYEVSRCKEVLEKLVEESDEDKFVEAICHALDLLQDEIKETKNGIKMYGGDLKFTIAYDFGMFNKVKSIETTIDLEEMVGEKFKVVINTDYTKGAKKQSYNKKKGVEVASLSNSELEEISTQISSKFIKKVMKNKEISKLIEQSGMLYYYGYDDVDEFIQDLLDRLSDDMYY